jgi:hypothetical protein
MRWSSVAAVAAAVVYTLTITTAAAQAFPQRPVRMIIANGAGSAPDVIGRLLAARLAESWSQPVIVDNRPGATGLIATELTAKAAPDGHTMLLSTLTNLIVMLMHQKYLLATELGAVTLVGTTPFAIVVGARYAGENHRGADCLCQGAPGPVAIRLGGRLGIHALVHRELQCADRAQDDARAVRQRRTDHDRSHWRKRSSSIVPPCRSCRRSWGENQGARGDLPRADQIASGRAAGSRKRFPGFELYGWYGMNVPLKTPPEIIKRINADLVKALKDPQLQERMINVGAEPVGSTPAEFTAFLNRNTEQWTKVLKESGAKLGQGFQ